MISFEIKGFAISAGTKNEFGQLPVATKSRELETEIKKQLAGLKYE